MTALDELAHHGLSDMPGCTEHDRFLRSRHSINRRCSAQEFR
jgi:hypothetical protein